MNIKVDLKEVKAGMEKFGAKTRKAGEKAMKDVVVLIANDVINIHPWIARTGNNSRSIRFEAKGLSGSVYSTSGYGGYLETGTVRMPAFPYFKPALDKQFPKFAKIMKGYM